MVDGQVRTTDVTSMPLLDALLSVPREEFVPAARKSLAYIDEDLEIAAPRPLPDGAVAVCAARPVGGDSPRRFRPRCRGRHRILVRRFVKIGRRGRGAGTGYRACRQGAGSAGWSLGYDTVAVVEGPLRPAMPAEAPYDVILLEGAVEQVPSSPLRPVEGWRTAAGRRRARQFRRRPRLCEAWHVGVGSARVQRRRETVARFQQRHDGIRVLTA